MTTPDGRTAILIAGVPSTNHTLYHRIRFHCGDPAAYVELHGEGRPRTELIIRDIEVARAKKAACADAVAAVQDFTPAGGLSSDRETATAQAAAELLRRARVSRVIADRTLPLSFAEEVRKLALPLEYDPDLGVTERRAKDEQEVAWLREAQRATEQTVEWACQTIARAEAARDGVLHHAGAPLTSERLFSMIDIRLLEQGYANDISIVAAGPQGADCHNRGSGPIRTGVPVIIDIFPRNKKTLYNGDCTRVVVHGDIPDAVARMHAAVVEAKAAAIGATRAGATADSVHKATMRVINAHGFERNIPPADAEPGFTSMQHGTGHGVGLGVHEPPLIDDGGPELIAGDCLTIEPGLYAVGLGGIRIEDMVIVTDDGCDNLNTIQEGLDWR